MPTDRKIQLVEDLKRRVADCTIAVATNPSGLDVNTMADLRVRLKERGIEYRVVKNTLAYIAADSVNTPEIREIVQGMTALAFGYGEPAEVAKILEDFIKTTRSSMTIRGAVMEHRVLTSQEVSILATLPPKAELLARLAGQLKSPIARLQGQLQLPLIGLTRTVNNPLFKFAMILQQRSRQLEIQG